MSWPVVTLEEVASRESRSITDGPFGSNLARRHYTESGPRVVRLQNIGDGYFVDSRAHISPDHFESLRMHEVQGGDLLVASLGEILPRACLAPKWLGPAIVKADCIRIRLGDEIDPRWALYALQRPEARKWAEAHRHGVGRPRLGLSTIRQIPIPLPPIEEQQRILASLEDNLSRLDAAASYLRAVQTRARALHKQLLDSALEQVDAALIPFGSTLTVGLMNGRSVPTRPGGFPVLRLTALRDSSIVLSERKEGAWTESDASRYLVAHGDFLISRGNGSLNLVGRGGLVVDEPDAVAFPDTLIRAQVDPSLVNPHYLAMVWNSSAVRRQIESSAKTTAGIFKVNQKDLGAILLPTPPLSEQSRIVACVGATREAVKRLVEQVDAAENRIASLRRTLLRAAFSEGLPGRD